MVIAVKYNNIVFALNNNATPPNAYCYANDDKAGTLIIKHSYIIMMNLMQKRTLDAVISFFRISFQYLQPACKIVSIQIWNASWMVIDRFSS